MNKKGESTLNICEQKLKDYNDTSPKIQTAQTPFYENVWR
jgi:hypothetical protein